MQLDPYLNFNGDCAAAFKFYEQCLRGKLVTLQTHGESPIASQVPASWHGMILHARLEVGDAVLMGSDAPPERYQRPQGIHVSLNLTDPAEADRIFKELAEGGAISMPIDETFWAARFGMLVDNFGIPWIINSDKTAGAA